MNNLKNPNDGKWSSDKYIKIKFKDDPKNLDWYSGKDFFKPASPSLAIVYRLEYNYTVDGARIQVQSKSCFKNEVIRWNWDHKLGLI